MNPPQKATSRITTADLKKVKDFFSQLKINKPVIVIFFDDMKGSFALKQEITEQDCEDRFHEDVRREHDRILSEIIEGSCNGKIIKSTGDGLLAVFGDPAVAVERSIEIIEKLRGHQYIRIKIGMDMGQVIVEKAFDVNHDVFGAPVDRAARVQSMADEGHILVTQPVYENAVRFIPKACVAWKEHGAHCGKEGEAAFDVFEPFTANVTKPMEKLRAVKVQAETQKGGDAPQSADYSVLPPVCRLPARHRMPYRPLGGGFVGRVKDLLDVHDMLQKRKTALIEGVGVVMGMGGVGKTQLAVEYVHRFGDHYPGGVFWVDADQGISSLICQIAPYAGIDIDNTKEENEQRQELWTKLSFNQPTLVALDNFPENEPIQLWIPPEGTIHILVTTRRRDLTGFSRIPLNVMNAEDGIKLLNRGRVRPFGSEAEVLVEALGGLPLALELARHFLIVSPDLAIDDLLKEIKETGEIEMMTAFEREYKDELPDGHVKEVAATFQISFNLASGEAKKILRCISLLAPAPVPKNLLRKMLNYQGKKGINDPLDRAVSELETSLSLVELDETGDPVMHRLVSGFIRTTAVKKDDPLYEKMTEAIRNEMARCSEDKDQASFHDLEKVVPHAVFLLDAKWVKPEQAIDMSTHILWYFQKWGRYRLGEKFGRSALQISEGHYEPGHPAIAISQFNLALVLHDLGNLAEARDLLRKSLASEEKSFEPGHPSIARSQSNLAMVLRDLGELAEARDLLRKSYKTFLTKFGHDHFQTKIVKRNLSSIDS